MWFAMINPWPFKVQQKLKYLEIRINQEGSKSGLGFGEGLLGEPSLQAASLVGMVGDIRLGIKNTFVCVEGDDDVPGSLLNDRRHSF
eukprot:6287128-Amphidinium_carterae.1